MSNKVEYIINKLAKIISRMMNVLPQRYTNALFEVILRFFPIWIIKKIPWSYSAYLRCYQPVKGDVVLDCGAHIGNCTLLFSRLVGKEGLVIALEPFETSYGIIRKRIKKYGLLNILPINKGIWNKKGEYSLKVFENTISCRIIEDNNALNTVNARFSAVTIDDLIKDLGLNKLDLIKMDIEGAEIEALQGAVATIERFQPNFAIASYHKRNNKQTFIEIERFLSSKGYDAFSFFPSHLTTCGKRVP